MENFEAALEDFRRTAEEVYRQHFADSDFTFAIARVRLMKPGKKYVRLVRVDENPETGEMDELGRSVHSFVDIETGDILKPAGWAKPAKHARGNIFDDNHGRDSMEASGCIRYVNRRKS